MRTCSRRFVRSFPALFQDGKFLGTDAYASMLAEQNFTIQEFEQNLRQQILVSRLNSLAVEGIIVTPAEIEQQYKRKNEKVKIEWVKLTADKYKSEVPAYPGSDAGVLQGQRRALPDS